MTMVIRFVVTMVIRFVVVGGLLVCICICIF